MLNFIPHKIKVVEIMKKITVTNIDISISVRPDNNDYICLTDMAHFKDRERTNYIIQNWMRLRSTIDFLGLWEKLNNPNFKGIEFDAFKMESGTNSFTLTPKQWIEKTKAIGIISKPGRYGGTSCLVVGFIGIGVTAEFAIRSFSKGFIRLKNKVSGSFSQV